MRRTRLLSDSERGIVARDLLVSEIFGPTFQGEGRSVGRLCVFLRLGGCNLHCSWCDTPYTWAFDRRHARMHESGKQYDPEVEMRRMSPEDVIAELLKLRGTTDETLLVVSGGEPMLQQDSLYEVLSFFDEVEIETAGTIVPTSLRGIDFQHVRFNVSPKLKHSGNELELRRNWNALEWLATLNSIFKFVVTAETWDADVKEIEEIQLKLRLPPGWIWIMPIGTYKLEQLHSLEYFADKVLEQGWNLTPRLHTLIWGNTRAR